MRLLSTIWRVIFLAFRALIAVPVDIVAWLRRVMGIGGPPPPPRYTPETSVSDILEDYKDSYVRELATDHAHVGEVGHTVHRYAAAEDSWVRSAVNLTGLDERQTDWLLGLREDDLRRLATAGPRACELAARGQRSGIVGLPMPEDRATPAQASGVVLAFPVRAFGT